MTGVLQKIHKRNYNFGGIIEWQEKTKKAC